MKNLITMRRLLQVGHLILDVVAFDFFTKLSFCINFSLILSTETRCTLSILIWRIHNVLSLLEMFLQI